MLASSLSLSYMPRFGLKFWILVKLCLFGSQCGKVNKKVPPEPSMITKCPLSTFVLCLCCYVMLEIKILILITFVEGFFLLGLLNLRFNNSQVESTYLDLKCLHRRFILF